MRKNINMATPFLLLIVLFLLSGCSSRGYDSGYVVDMNDLERGPGVQSQSVTSQENHNASQSTYTRPPTSADRSQATDPFPKGSGSGTGGGGR